MLFAISQSFNKNRLLLWTKPGETNIAHMVSDYVSHALKDALEGCITQKLFEIFT